MDRGRRPPIQTARKEWRALLALLVPGKIAPEIQLPDLKDKYTSIRNFEKSPLVIYFWASWNKQSRNSNLALNMLYKKYKKRGLNIYGIALDKEINTFKDAIEVDEIKWNSYYDRASLQSEYVKTYNIKDIPVFYLLDTANIIINRYTSTTQLEFAVDSIMKKYE